MTILHRIARWLSGDTSSPDPLGDCESLFARFDAANGKVRATSAKLNAMTDELNAMTGHRSGCWVTDGNLKFIPHPPMPTGLVHTRSGIRNYAYLRSVARRAQS